MKKIILILCCLTLTAAVGWAKDYHLVETHFVDSVVASGESPVFIYVLIPPDNSTGVMVFKTLDSKSMETQLSLLEQGSIVHFDPDGRAPSEPTQLEALKICCQKKGISFIVGNKN
jgi:hypothetical protein